MRTLFIALIFVGLVSLSFGADTTPTVIQPWPTAQNCTSNASVTGCNNCTQVGDSDVWTCSDAAEGYFVSTSTNQSQACPRACKKCMDEFTCEECRTDGFVDTNEAVGQKCEKCKSGFAFDSTPLDQTNSDLESVCISVAADGAYSCYTNYYWDSNANPTRKCVKNGANCQTGYSTDGTNTIANANCNSCLTKGYSSLISLQEDGNKKQYYAYSCLKTSTPPAPRVVEQCTKDVNETASCTNCTEGVCYEAAAGFYLATVTQSRILDTLDEAATPGQLLACPLSCATCSNNQACDTCGTGSTKQGGSCECDAAQGYVPSIEKQQKVTVPQDYKCIQQANNEVCSTGYTWNSQVVIPATVGQCISLYGTTSCYYKEKDSLENNFWNSPPNPKRACVLATSKQCLPSYAQKQGDKSNIYEVDLTSNCGACVGDATLNTADQNNQVCQANLSSLLGLSLGFLGIVIALLI